jgi:hypothetical protein
MAGYAQPDNLVEAILSDEVYHDPTDPVAPPSSNQWTFLTCYYDQTTGYYGEAWEKTALDANDNPIKEIVQVNRGTTFSSAGNDPYLETIDLPTNTLEVNSSATLAPDRLETMSADLEIVADIRPSYFTSANDFYATLRLKYGSAIPIVETGQSLGGATANDVLAENAGDVVRGVLTSVTFNALPLSNVIPDYEPDSNLSEINSASSNYYVGNEVATQGFLSDTFVFSSPIGKPFTLPSTPVSGALICRPIL